MKPKFQLEDYLDNCAMHCPEEWMAKKFCDLLHKSGRSWCSEVSYAKHTYWQNYRENTCYAFNFGAFSEIEYYKKNRYTILEFSDFDWSDGTYNNVGTKCVKGNDHTNYEAKADEGKLQISLVPTQIIRDIAEVRMYGNKKYHDPENWKAVEMERYVDALMRHTLAFLDDRNSVDEESGISHYKHMACNMAFICHMMNGGNKDEI